MLFLTALLVLLDIYGTQGYSFVFWAGIAWRPVLFAVVLALLIYEGCCCWAAIWSSKLSTFGGALIRHLRQPLGVLAPVIATQLLLPSLELPPTLANQVHHALALIDIAAIGWLVVRLTSVAEDVMHQHYLVNFKDNLGARRIHTQFQMLRRIVVVAVQVLALAVMMMTFPESASSVPVC